jgi:protein-disulfide isomerase
MSALSALLRVAPAALVFGILAGCQQGASEAPTAPTPAASTSGTAAAAPASSGASDIADDAVVASWDGGSLTYGELREQIDSQLVQLEMEYLQGRYRAQQQAAEGMGLRAVVAAEAKALGTDEEGLIKTAVEDKVSAPTDAEIDEFYPVVKRQLRNAPLDKVRDQVAAMLVERQKGELLQAYIGELREKYKLDISVPFPDLPRIDMSADDDPSVGPANARVTIIEFGDYECGYCGRAFATVQEVRAKYPDDVRVVYRDFPLSFHPRAVPAAVAANCAGKQDKYWEMHNSLMQNQRKLDDDGLKEQAEGLGLDMAAWQSCVDASDVQIAEIENDFSAGEAAGVSGTPAFFINGIFLSGAQPIDQFETIIERELQGS